MVAAMFNLGELDGPVLIFGGPYSNLAATRAMRLRAEQLGISPERTICTGDVVAYCAEPAETVALVRDWGIAVVQGNCEEALALGAQDCGCGFEDGTTCSLLADGWYRFAHSRIDTADQTWMRDLPGSLQLNLNGRSILVVHGGVDQTNRFIFPSTATDSKREELDQAGTDLLIGGHSGIPSGTRIGGRAWLNSGAIGLPANDGTPDGWYLLLLPEGNKLRCRWQRLRYPFAQPVAAMRAAGLVNGYMETLSAGLWPSMDVLPAPERARQGEALVLSDLLC